MHENQLAALQAAAAIIKDLPQGAVYGLEVTNDDDWESPSVLNLYARNNDEFEKFHQMMNFAIKEDQGEAFTTYRVGPMHVSIIRPEEA